MLVWMLYTKSGYFGILAVQRHLLCWYGSYTQRAVILGF